MTPLSAVVFAIVVVGNTVSAGPENGLAEMERKTLTKCNEKIKAPDSAIDNIIYLRDFDSSKEFKCLIQCGMEEFGVMMADGKVDAGKANGYIVQAYPDKAEVQEKAKELWHSCVEKVEQTEDKCEHAFALMDCYRESSRKENLPEIQ